MTTNALSRPLTSLSALTAAWRFVDGGHGYSAPQLWALLLDRRGRIAADLLQMYDEAYADGPDEQLLSHLVDRLAETLAHQAPGGSVALMKARPGRSSALTRADTRWCRALHRHLQSAPFASKPLFFACDDGPRVLAPDELMGDDAA